MGNWRVRVRGPGGEGLCGAGVLIADGLILTCAHVVTEALGLPSGSAAPDGAAALVDFSPCGDPRPRPARPVEGGWSPTRPASGDFAVLTLEPGAAPPAARPAALYAGDGSEHTPVSVYGYPRPGLADGVWVEATATGPGGPDPVWRQLDGRADGVAIQRGFSGAGVWDRRLGGVIGLVVAAYASSVERVAWMIPLGAVARGWPPLTALLTPVAANGGGADAPRHGGIEADGGIGVDSAIDAVEPTLDAVELTPHQCALLAQQLATVPVLATLGGRHDLVSLLRPQIGAMVAERSEPQAHLYHVVRTTSDFEGGLDELIGAVRLLAGDSRAVRSVAATVRRFAEEGHR